MVDETALYSIVRDTGGSTPIAWGRSLNSVALRFAIKGRKRMRAAPAVSRFIQAGPSGWVFVKRGQESGNRRT